jgi:mRNA interferase YafQ
VLRRGKNIEELIAAVELLAENGVLPEEYRAHKLSGEWKVLWECHIEPDWPLIYDITSAEVLLIRTGALLPFQVVSELRPLGNPAHAAKLE